MTQHTSYFQWTSAQKLAFRFFFLFFILYIFFNPNGGLPGVDGTLCPEQRHPAAVEIRYPRWNKLIVGTGTASSIKLLNNSTKRYIFRYDRVAKKLTMYTAADTANKSVFAYSLPGKDIMELRGPWNGDSTWIRMKKFDLNRFRLINRGLNWVNEYPYNR